MVHPFSYEFPSITIQIKIATCQGMPPLALTFPNINVHTNTLAIFHTCRISDEEDPENEDGGNTSVYRLKYERVAKELEFTKRRLQTQHEHDLEQLVGLKKQLEKKLSDAYEEVEEQRQVVGQWKRKNQKLTSEMNDLKMLLEEQNGRNNILEKRQRKFDSECQALQVDRR